ncbi:MAG: hypothetical protein VX764_01410 [Planctomycetota bacterium]|nr:hypothetical protein [Planctomycetota bacterium]
MSKDRIKASFTTLLLGSVFGITVGWFAGGTVSASAEYQELVGLWRAELLEETYDMSIGLDGLGKPRPARGRFEQRTQLLLPQHYGNLVSITGNGTAAVLWYQDGLGVIRNAIIPDANSQAVRVQLQNTTKLKTKVMRD